MSRFWLLLPVLATFACSSQAALVGQGGACEVVTDCQNGLVCEPEKNDAGRICTGDLGPIEQLPPTPPGADAGPVGDANVNDDVAIPTSLPDSSGGGG